VNSEVDSSLIDQHLSLAIFLLYLCDEPGFYSIFIQRSIEAQAAIQTLEQSAHLQWSISSNLTIKLVEILYTTLKLLIIEDFLQKLVPEPSFMTLSDIECTYDFFLIFWAN
jgi:hypothetical protein